MTIGGFLTTAEVAVMLGVETQTLRQWRRKSVGPTFHKRGRWVRYDPTDVAAWLERSKNETPADPKVEPAIVARPGVLGAAPHTTEEPTDTAPAVQGEA